MIGVTVVVRGKDGILDPQGGSIERSLTTLGYTVGGVRAGKVFDLVIDAPDATTAEATAREIAERVLANPLMERYDVTVHA